jgi:hypothetical protein
MKIYIEVLIVFVLIILYLIWILWFKYLNWRALKKYKPENDKARKGGTIIGGVKETKSANGVSTTSIVRLGQFEGRRLLQKTNVDDVRTNSSSTRKFLRRR